MKSMNNKKHNDGMQNTIKHTLYIHIHTIILHGGIYQDSNCRLDSGLYTVHCDMTLCTRSFTILLVSPSSVDFAESFDFEVLVVLDKCVVSLFTKCR
jgi:hypothetical protein